MSDEKITECFFEDSPCLWQGNPKCKACARGRDYLHPRTDMMPGIMVGILLVVFLVVMCFLVS